MFVLALCATMSHSEPPADSEEWLWQVRVVALTENGTKNIGFPVCGQLLQPMYLLERMGHTPQDTAVALRFLESQNEAQTLQEFRVRGQSCEIDASWKVGEDVFGPTIQIETRRSGEYLDLKLNGRMQSVDSSGPFATKFVQTQRLKLGATLSAYPRHPSRDGNDWGNVMAAEGYPCVGIFLTPIVERPAD